MDATTYTGNGTTQTITNAGAFKPDFVWIKRRNIAADHVLYDSVRTLGVALSSNLTSAEPAQTNGLLTAFNSNGYGVAVVSGDNSTNGSTQTYVGWQWQAGQGSTSSNTSGSITSTVSVNTTAGFSVVTYTGTGANATVGHGLGVAPKFIITKSRNNAYNWCVYAPAANSGSGQNGGFYLNRTDAWFSDSGFWNNTAASSSTFTLGSGFAVNGSGATFVAYCWAAIAGYSAFGSYTGNGSSDGSFIFTGFTPKFIMIKCTDTAGTAWVLYDTTRDTYNQMTNILLPNSSSAELSGYSLDVLSNGFKHRQGGGDPNASGRNYIYACFASNPFKNSNAR
jgi:hypothetical protein